MPASAQHDRILRRASAALPSHDERLDALLHLAQSASGARVAFVSTVVGDRERIRAQVGTLGGLRAGASAPLSDGLLGHVLTMQAPVAVPHTRHHLLTKESRWIGPSVAGSVLSVPMSGADGSQSGALTICDSLPHEWTLPQIRLLERIVAFSVPLAQSAHSHSTLADDRGLSERCTRLLVSVLVLAASATSAPALIAMLTRLVVPFLADWCVLYERTSVDDSLAPSVVSSYPYTPDVLERTIPLTSRVGQARLGVKQAFETGLVQRTSDSVVAGQNRGRPFVLVPDNPPVTPREVVTIPLSDDAAPRRVLVLARKRDRAPFERVELDAATYAADAVAIALIRLDARPCISTAG